MIALPWPYWLFLTALALGSVLGIAALLDQGDADGGGGDDLEADAALDAWWSALGIGRVPLGVLVTVDLMLFGGLGIVSTEGLRTVLPFSLAAFIALPFAFVTSLALGAKLARVISRRLPGIETHGARRSDLIGRLGRAELSVDQSFGRARVRDDGGALHQVRCVTPGQPLERGTELVVTDMDAETGVYVVERADLWFDPNYETLQRTRTDRP